MSLFDENIITEEYLIARGFKKVSEDVFEIARRNLGNLRIWTSYTYYINEKVFTVDESYIFTTTYGTTEKDVQKYEVHNNIFESIELEILMKEYGAI